MIERLQSREGQEQQLDQTNRGTSSSKKGDFWRSQCQLYDNQQQSKGKELALAEWKDPFNGIAIGEGGKPVERQIVLSKCYGKDNPGLAGGGLEEVETVLGSFLEISANIADIASKVAPEPITHYTFEALKAVLQTIQKNKENAIINEKLDKLGNNPFDTASRLLNDVDDMQQPDNRKMTLHDSATLFVSALGTVKDGFLRTASMFYSGVCNDLRGELVIAMKHFKEAHKTGHEQLIQATKDMEKLRRNPFKRKKRAELESQLQDFRQFMEYLEMKMKNLKERIGSYPFSNTAIQISQHRIQELESINQAQNQEIQKLEKKLQEIAQRLEQKSFQQGDHWASTSRWEGTNHRDTKADLGKRIQEYFDSGRNNFRNGQFEEARDDFSRVIALDGNHAEAFVRRGVTYMELGRHIDEALADFTKAIYLDKNCFAAILQRGTLYRAIGQHEEALADLTNALNIARNDIKGLALEERGMTYWKMGRYREARADLTEALNFPLDNLQRCSIEACINELNRRGR